MPYGIYMKTALAAVLVAAAPFAIPSQAQAADTICWYSDGSPEPPGGWDAYPCDVTRRFEDRIKWFDVTDHIGNASFAFFPDGTGKQVTRGQAVMITPSRRDRLRYFIDKDGDVRVIDHDGTWFSFRIPEEYINRTPRGPRRPRNGFVGTPFHF
jgi:hypothetical protein